MAEPAIDEIAMLNSTTFERKKQRLCLFVFGVISLSALCTHAGFASSASAQKRRDQGATTSSRTDVQREDAASLLREAAALLQAGKLDKAEPFVRRAVRLAPRNADAHNLLGVILDQHGHAPEAERAYRESLRLNSKNIATLANLGVLLARTDRHNEAMQAFETVLRMMPEHPQAMINLGLLYATRGEYQRAVPLLERANASSPNTFTILYNLGVALYSLNRLDEAARALESATSLVPDASQMKATPLYYLGLTASARGNAEAAVDYWQRALALRADFADANFMIGEELRKQRRYEGAAEFYNLALAQDSSKIVYYVRLGGVYMLLVQYDKALELLERAARRFPNKPEIFYFIGVAARGRGAFETAETALRKSLALRPDDVDTLAQLGFIVGERGNFAEAEKLLRRAMMLSDKHFYAFYDLGRLLVKMKRYEESLPVLRRGEAIKPNNAGVHYQQFIALSRLKRKEDAERELTRFKRLEEEGKTRRRDEDDIENPGGSASESPPRNN